MSLEYTNLSHETMLADWNNRVLADERFKNLSHASIYSYFQEFLAGVMDMTNYYIQRTAEESYLDSAKLDSSHIKLSHNLGYQPKRPVPAVADISIELRGPLPRTVKAGDTIWLNSDSLTFTFNGHDFMLDACYSYTLTARDVADGQDPSWRKRIAFAVNGYTTQREGYIALDGRVDAVTSSKLFRIGVVQGKKVKKIIDSMTESSQIGQAYQRYDIDDLSFSNWYGVRDPFASVDGQYDKKYGVCKIGIGATEAEAMSDSGLYEIEDEAVELNSKIKSGVKNVCCVKSNWDKTVQITFGNGVNVSPGLTSVSQKLVVQYLSTDGSDANYPDAAGSELRPAGKIYASGAGSMTNVSSNVTFLFESAIHGGQDFESQRSMKISSKLYFASSGKLITLPDFKSWLLTLTDPIIVKHAVAYGENQLEAYDADHIPGISNFVLYSLFSDVYRQSDGQWRPINVFDEDEDLSSTSLYVDYQTYMSHLIDFVKIICAPKSAASDQYRDGTVFGQWCKTIRSQADGRMMTGTKLLSVPPIFHYYDVVGDVTVDRHADMSAVKTEIEGSLYQWLSESVSFGTRVYKSDIMTQILRNPDAKRADIDIKVSDWIKGETKTYRIDIGEAEARQDVLIFSVRDMRGNDLRDVFSEMEGQNFTLQVQDGSAAPQTFLIVKYSADDDNVYLQVNGLPVVDSSFFTDLIVEEDSLYKRGNLSGVNKTILSAIEDWLSSKKVVDWTDQRPIELPYKIDFTSGINDQQIAELEEQRQEALRASQYARDEETRREANEEYERLTALLERPETISGETQIVRLETFLRRGADSTDLQYSASENSFYYMLMELVRSGRATIEQIADALPYAYPILKVIFEDNVLDDSNNIVYFGSDREIPVLRLRFRYTYA